MCQEELGCHWRHTAAHAHQNLTATLTLPQTQPGIVDVPGFLGRTPLCAPHAEQQRFSTASSSPAEGRECSQVENGVICWDHRPESSSENIPAGNYFSAIRDFGSPCCCMSSLSLLSLETDSPSPQEHTVFWEQCLGMIQRFQLQKQPRGGLSFTRTHRGELCIPSEHWECWSICEERELQNNSECLGSLAAPEILPSLCNGHQNPPKAPTNKRDPLQRLCCAGTLVYCKVREKQQLKKQLQTHSLFYIWALAA